MRIALINNRPKESGMGRYAFELHEILRGECKIDHIFLNYDRKSIDKIEDNSTTSTIAQVMSIPLIDNKPFFWYRLRDKLPEYDLYHLTNQNVSFLARNGLRIVTCHDLIPYMYPSNQLEFYLRRYLYSGLKESIRIISDSEQTKRNLVSYFKIPENVITVIQLGVNHRIFKRLGNTTKVRHDLTRLTLLHVGAEPKNKNVGGLIKALGKLQREGLDAELIRVGNKSQAVAKLIRELHLEDKVHYHQNVDDNGLVELYNAADLFVFPSFYEGFGLPPLEAMACGTPVVTSNTSSLPEVVGDAAITVDPHDVDTLAKAMYDILTNNSLKENLVKKGLERAKLFSWEKTAKETLRVYEDVMKTRQNRSR